MIYNIIIKLYVLFRSGSLWFSQGGKKQQKTETFHGFQGRHCLDIHNWYNTFPSQTLGCILDQAPSCPSMSFACSGLCNFMHIIPFSWGPPSISSFWSIPTYFSQTTQVTASPWNSGSDGTDLIRLMGTLNKVIFRKDSRHYLTHVSISCYYYYSNYCYNILPILFIVSTIKPLIASVKIILYFMPISFWIIMAWGQDPCLLFALWW